MPGTVSPRGGGYLGVAHLLRPDKANNMITLTAIVLALGLGWAVIKVWNAVSSQPAPEAIPAQATETAKHI